MADTQPKHDVEEQPEVSKEEPQDSSNKNKYMAAGVGCLIIVIALVVGLVVGLDEDSFQSPAGVYKNLIKDLNLNPSSSDEDISEAINIMAEHYSEVCVGGSVMGVSRPSGRIVVSNGVLKEGENATLNGDTVFEIGSVSKPICGLELARQISAGMITLNTTANSLLPDSVPDMIVNGELVTMKHLVTHTAGLPRTPASIDLDVDYTQILPFANFTEEDMFRDLATAVEEGLDQSGKSEYSNLGFYLLGYLLGVNVNSTFPAIQQEMTDSLGLDRTFIGHFPNAMKPELATGYMMGTTETPYWYDGGIYIDGAGSTLSTVNDMLSWTEALMDPNSSVAALDPTENADILAALSLSQEALFATSDSNGLAYSWYYYYYQHSDSLIYYKHSGSTVGFSTHVAFQPATQTAVVGITNCGEIYDIYYMGDIILEKLFE